MPNARLSRWRLPFSALVFGTMVPDIAGYYLALLDYRTTHSVLGVITHCMPTRFPQGLVWFVLAMIVVGTAIQVIRHDYLGDRGIATG